MEGSNPSHPSEPLQPTAPAVPVSDGLPLAGRKRAAAGELSRPADSDVGMHEEKDRWTPQQLSRRRRIAVLGAIRLQSPQ